ncbi:MAG: HAMP domain-containing sensor histidine kinase [Halarcobacter sp.]
MNKSLLKKHTPLYSKNILALIKYWIKNKNILNILKKHEIKTETFVKNYGIAIIEYFIAVVREEEKIGSCPFIDELLIYLKGKDVTSSELFIICSGLRNSFIEFSYDFEIISLEIEKEITYLFEESFIGILEKYSKSIFVLQKEIEQHKNVLVEQSKSAAMGEMIAIIAHQWRQPLQSVSILVQKLPIVKMMEGKIEDDFLDEVVEEVVKQLVYMSKTIDNFRDFFLPNKSKEFISIKKLLDKSLEFTSLFIKNDSIKINILAKEDFEIFIYVNELIQVLINILKNSKDAMHESNISNKEINIKYYKENSFAIIEIEDNARGISQNIIEKVFDPYFSTKSNKNGTGLGLYMSKTIIEKHCNGKISVSNSKNGALFKITLPMS